MSLGLTGLLGLRFGDGARNLAATAATLLSGLLVFQRIEKSFVDVV